MTSPTNKSTPDERLPDRLMDLADMMDAAGNRDWAYLLRDTVDRLEELSDLVQRAAAALEVRGIDIGELP